jgi:hypothetical protein
MSISRFAAVSVCSTVRVRIGFWWNLILGICNKLCRVNIILYVSNIESEVYCAWDARPCILVEVYQHFREIYSLHLQGMLRKKKSVSQKRWYFSVYTASHSRNQYILHLRCETYFTWSSNQTLSIVSEMAPFKRISLRNETFNYFSMRWIFKEIKARIICHSRYLIAVQHNTNYNWHFQLNLITLLLFTCPVIKDSWTSWTLKPRKYPKSVTTIFFRFWRICATYFPAACVHPPSPDSTSITRF